MSKEFRKKIARIFIVTVLEISNKRRSHLYGINIAKKKCGVINCGISKRGQVREISKARSISGYKIRDNGGANPLGETTWFPRHICECPLRSKDSCHECSRIKETANSSGSGGIFL